MTNIDDKRCSPRLKHKAPVAVFWPSGERKELWLRDLSEGGVFIECAREDIPATETVMKIQSLELEMAPVIEIEVVRAIPDIGFAGRFIAEGKDD